MTIEEKVEQKARDILAGDPEGLLRKDAQKLEGIAHAARVAEGRDPTRGTGNVANRDMRQNVGRSYFGRRSPRDIDRRDK